MDAIMLDIDDTLVNPSRRMQAIWQEVLGRDVPLEVIESMETESILAAYASAKQTTLASKLRRRFWNLVLCLDPLGEKLLKLDEPLPDAATVVNNWNLKNEILYLTGRTENTRNLTDRQLKNFGFPIEKNPLLMLQLEDYTRTRGISPTGPTLTEAKSRLFSAAAAKWKIVKVVDDFPNCFPIYKQFEVQERIGFHVRRFSRKNYFENGALRVIESWGELLAEDALVTLSDFGTRKQRSE